ncbi:MULTISPECIES: Yip1 family protein [Gammaproteobacteria]|uniref:Yip1 domain-containing protein n=3 Tax=Halomonadaceae TaxID=28256 RepID=A0A2A2FA69_9GAMM|nr:MULTISPECIES: Yip1 family protein [Gammaproteobacteria]KAA8983580.1 YIP1 family protein [Halospina sp. K52047b]MYL27283.1 DUF1282 domain-containing protein [Halomonas utahensis]MYL74485.1 DUF1282 domain-containing protein [Halomonas sp. 22501_18_FS]PAU81634.1 hypothetical protein CK501_00325 [Halovibrio salipaludis]
MSPLMLFRLILPSSGAWARLRDHPPSVLALILFPVLPLALIPPIMLYQAGTGYPEAFGDAFAGREWGYITIILFLAELLTFAVMGWLIHEVGNTRSAHISAHSAYLVAAVAPVPMWLSAFALFVPSLTVITSIALIGLIWSCAIVFRGISHLCRIGADVEAMSITYTVMAASVLAWGLLLAIIWGL